MPSFGVPGGVLAASNPFTSLTPTAPPGAIATFAETLLSWVTSGSRSIRRRPLWSTSGVGVKASTFSGATSMPACPARHGSSGRSSATTYSAGRLCGP